MKYINKYETEAEVQAAINNGELLNPYVAYITSSDTIDWNSKREQHNYSKDYLTFKISSGGTIVWKKNSSYSTTRTISYSKDSGSTWTSINSSTDGASFNVSDGDVVYFKSDNTSVGYSNFGSSTAKFELEGNIMSLLYGDDFSGQTTLQSTTAFVSLFQNCTGLTSAENLVLPATTLTDGCYQNMFAGCTSLTTAPELPATTLASLCYQNMFNGCTSLTTAPSVLPASIIAGNAGNGNGSYVSMFAGCTSLTTAPNILANEMQKDACMEMFNGCTSLNYVKCLASTFYNGSDNCCWMWLRDVQSTGTFVKKAGVNWKSPGLYNSGIPNGWTVIEE